MTEAPQISTTIVRSGFLIEIDGLGASVTFHPYDKDRTYDLIIAKLKEFGQDLTSNIPNSEIHYERHNIDIQLTEVYDEYYKKLESKQIKDEDQLLIIAYSHIKEIFQDQTDRYFAVIEKDNHDEIINLDTEEFDKFLLKIYHEGEKQLISKDKRRNTVTFLKSCSTNRRFLYNRIAKIGDVIYYDLCNEKRQCVRIGKEEWKIIDNPLLFWPQNLDREQFLPDRGYDKNRHYLHEIIETSTIKYDHQKLIDEICTAALFIPDIAHPLQIPIGPAESGKTTHLRVKKLIVDPLENFDGLVQRLPRDERDRRVTIYDNYISYFDNESMLNNEEMNELCTWVTGYSKTIRTLYTTDERRTYSGKRPIGINGINIPVSNSDALSRCLITEHSTLVKADNKDGKIGKSIERESKYLNNIKKMVPYTLGYVFDVLGKALQIFDEVDSEISPTDRLADWIIWGETISRAVGYPKNAFLDAWERNKEGQSYAVIRNNSLAILLIRYAFNKRPELEFSIEPSDLLRELKEYAIEVGIDYHSDRNLPSNEVWLGRKLNMIKGNLNVAGLVIDETKSEDRLIWIRKNYGTYSEQQHKQKKLEEMSPQT